MTVGRSEQAKTFDVDRDLKVLSTVGWVPRVTFLRSLRAPRHKRWKTISFQCLRVALLTMNENKTDKRQMWGSLEILNRTFVRNKHFILTQVPHRVKPNHTEKFAEVIREKIFWTSKRATSEHYYRFKCFVESNTVTISTSEKEKEVTMSFFLLSNQCF